MARFCGKCGSTLNENGICPKCDLEKISADKESFSNKAEQENTYAKELTKKEKKVKEKADKAAEKVKKKADNKIGKVLAKAKHKTALKPDKAARITKKADKKAGRIALKADKKAAEKAAKATKKASRTIGRKIGSFLIKLSAVTLAIVILFSTVSGILVYFGIADVPVVSDVMDMLRIKNNVSESININEYLDYSNHSRNFEEERIDAMTYYNKYSKVINEVSMDESKNMMSEEEAYNLFQSYGFTECIIVSEYTDTGEYSGPNEIVPFSSNKHPVYRSDYVDEKGNIFEVYLIEGLLMVNPVSFNAKTEDNIKVIVSSAKTLKSYDSETKNFYETMPKNSIIKVQEASESYIETLDKLTFEEETQ